MKTKKKKYFLESSLDVRVFVLSAWAISLICSAIFENIDAYLIAVRYRFQYSLTLYICVRYGSQQGADYGGNEETD